MVLYGVFFTASKGERRVLHVANVKFGTFHVTNDEQSALVGKACVRALRQDGLFSPVERANFVGRDIYIFSKKKVTPTKLVRVKA